MSQILKKLNISIARVEDVFFASMLAGYINSEEIKTQNLVGMSGYKFTEFINSDFRVVDARCKTSGFTSIWYEDVLVWTMNYGGHYDKKHIGFLKSVLRQTYSQRIFCGGRGVAMLKGVGAFEQFTYVNVQLANNDFKRFTGSELIFERKQEVGYHNYLGGLVY